MHEDKAEALEKMFPKGFIITYIQPNGDPAYHWFNPCEDEFLGLYLEAMHRLFNTGEYEG